MKEKESKSKRKNHQGGRPPKASVDRKTVQLKIWVTPREAEEIKEKAKSEGFKYTGQFISRVVNERVFGQPVIVQFSPQDMYTLSQLANNLNQIAKHLNSGGRIWSEMFGVVIDAKNITVDFQRQLNSEILKSKKK